MPKEPEKKQKIDFNQLNDGKVKGDAVYEDTKQRIRDKKALRKETEKQIKGRVEKEVEYMGSSIQRSIDNNMAKAQGLKRKRKVEDKTPRVHKRHQYEKLMKTHNKRVSEFKRGPQKLYSGQENGLRSGITKSTRLN